MGLATSTAGITEWLDGWRRLQPPQPPNAEETTVVERLLGRPANVQFALAVVDADGQPVVIANEPFANDGTPMPTTYWLVATDAVRAVSQLESAGGVRQAEQVVDEQAVAATHRRYAAARDARIAAHHRGPKPSGGVGGTAIGVKCLHAHVAHFLATGDDPVGAWALEQLRDGGSAGG